MEADYIDVDVIEGIKPYLTPIFDKQMRKFYNKNYTMKGAYTKDEMEAMRQRLVVIKERKAIEYKKKRERYIRSRKCPKWLKDVFGLDTQLGVVSKKE